MGREGTEGTGGVAGESHFDEVSFDPGFRQLYPSFLLFKCFERSVERFARTMLPSSRKRFSEGGLHGALTSKSPSQYFESCQGREL